MAEITYLLGAGASCNTLPIVSEMASAIHGTISWLRKIYIEHSIKNRYNTADGQKFDNVISDLIWLAEACDTTKNFSIDTYARKLNISGKFIEYQKLKNVLSFYFTIVQRQSLPDVRYDNFWASILKSKANFPNNVKIISWNYDFQLELTYQSFLGVDSLRTARETLNVSSLETQHFISSDANEFGVYKLNGSATLSSNEVGQTNYWIDNFYSLKIDEFVIELVDLYEKLKNNNINNHLSFAWEHSKKNSFFEQLKHAVSNTEVLVVIGYSFPFFNRETDKLIFKEFMAKTLDKVYFQAPDAEDLKERFLAINDRIDPGHLVLRKDLKQFTLPNEL